MLLRFSNLGLEQFSQIGGRYLHAFAVFGHGAAGAVYALFFQHGGNFVVAERFFRVFSRDKLFDERPHRYARRVAPAFGAEA